MDVDNYNSRNSTTASLFPSEMTITEKVNRRENLLDRSH